MASRSLQSSRRVVYLDQSTLSDAFRFGFVGGKASEPEYAVLFSWIVRVAREENLCLSPVHILETARWSEAEGDALAEWLDGLETVWAYPYHRVQAMEDERLVRVVAGQVDPPPVSPFAPSFLRALQFSPTPEWTASALRDPSMRNAVGEVRRRNYNVDLAFAPAWVRMLHDDRAAARQRGVSEQQLRDRLALNWRVGLRRRAAEAHDRLIAGGDLDYMGTGARWGDVQDPFVAAYDADPAVLPVTMVIRAFSAGFERETKNKKPGSRKIEKTLASGFYDICHAAVGASYCDVFTCDDFTARCLGDARTRLGLGPALARDARASTGAFVAQLTGSFGGPK